VKTWSAWMTTVDVLHQSSLGREAWRRVGLTGTNDLVEYAVVKN